MGLALGSPSGGKRSAVAVVNDSPVDCQSRDRVCRSKLAPEGRLRGLNVVYSA